MLKHSIINHSIKRAIKVSAVVMLSLSLLSGCGGGEGGGGLNLSGLGGGNDNGQSQTSDPAQKRQTVESPLITEPSGAVVFGSDTASIDCSHLDDGYLMISYTGPSQKVQVQITNPNGEVYPYPLGLGDWRAFPLTGGSGSYNIDILECVSGDLYSVNFSQKIDAQIADEFRPYLFPNQYVDYKPDSNVVSLGKSLSDQSSEDINYVENVYNYTISNITYDTEFAQNAPVNYIPNPDATLASGKGICFDYASVMSSMLRSQGIPTKLVVGYSGEAYHAWISVYLKETGWVDNIIQFDGLSWSLMDPTLGASNNASAVAQYVGDGSNYLAKYTY